ncbi:Dyp-type peroxidase [Enterobacter pseudoroggenkampii]|uniref:Dyp-type peroxidase n=1 Tax=Enterobacter pseudoroggenkampii TaxID=2996112 RepID=UPI00389F325F
MACPFSQSVSQAVDEKLTSAAIFLVVTLNPGTAAETTVRTFCATLSSLVRGVGFRIADGGLSCVLGFGEEGWRRLFGDAKPKYLHTFREINGVHHAPSTAGDLLFHIRANRMDLCFELATRILSDLGNSVSVVDSVQGFRYFDNRDLLGFVDGTENPVAQSAVDATLIGDEDGAFSGGSYVIIQKYLHDLDKWKAIPVEQQEKIIGREKLTDVELKDADKPSYAHNVLTSIEEDGEDVDILRDNMPFGDPGKGEFGTYFIGYSRKPERIERMLENMFIGNPPGNYDRILDVSRAITGALFFIPTSSFLDSVEPQPELSHKTEG